MSFSIVTNAKHEQVDDLLEVLRRLTREPCDGSAKIIVTQDSQ